MSVIDSKSIGLYRYTDKEKRQPTVEPIRMAFTRVPSTDG